MKVLKQCKYCGKDFIKEMTLSRIKTGRGKYCSRSCLGKDKKGQEGKNWKGGLPKCQDCNTPLKNRYAKYCRKCFGGHQSKENHPNWKDNATVKQRGIRWTYEYRIWRQSVLKRDDYQCQMPECNKDYNLQVHHIETMKNRPEYIFEISNGITLCKNCHLSIASKEQDYEQLFKEIINNHLCLV